MNLGQHAVPQGMFRKPLARRFLFFRQIVHSRACRLSFIAPSNHRG
jgi:hypothetical protein